MLSFRSNYKKRSAWNC